LITPFGAAISTPVRRTKAVLFVVSIAYEVHRVALFGLFRRKTPYDAAAQRLYQSAVDAARRPYFYRHLGVPDTLDGRFEMIVLHVFPILYRLKHDPAAPQGLSQALFDTLFTDMDRSLREMGAGDLGVAPRMKKMWEGFNGRVQAYDRSLSSGDAPLSKAVARNIYGTVDADPTNVEEMTAYLRLQVEALMELEVDSLVAGRVTFQHLSESETSR
jgi:cytochrome b pre-mRNA-processing protein 3